MEGSREKDSWQRSVIVSCSHIALEFCKILRMAYFQKFIGGVKNFTRNRVIITFLSMRML